jgi:peptidoglycan-associated lipoprotein
MNRFLKFLPILAITLGLVSCKGATVKEDSAGTAVPDNDIVTEESMAVAGTDGDTIEVRRLNEVASSEELETKAEKGRLYTVHFDFDKYKIKSEYKDELKHNARWLKKNKGAKIRIEGHADERGENEYNLALGEKRAISVKNYLAVLGANPGNLTTLSYGEEKPLNKGHNEEAWGINRRADFTILSR